MLTWYKDSRERLGKNPEPSAEKTDLSIEPGWTFSSEWQTIFIKLKTKNQKKEKKNFRDSAKNGTTS